MHNLLKRSLWVMSLIMVFNAQSADLTVCSDVLKKYGFPVAKDSSREQLMSSALSLVAYHNAEHVALLETLLKKLFKEPIEARKAILNGVCLGGCTLLVAAVVSKNVKKVNLLLNYGADSNVKDSKYQWTPLVHALKNSSFDIALLLCSRGADQVLDDCCRGSIAFLRRQIALKNEKKSKDKGACQVEKKKKQPAIDPDSIYGILVASSGPAHFTFDEKIINQNAASLLPDDLTVAWLQSDYMSESDSRVKDVVKESIVSVIAQRNERCSQVCLADLIENQPDILLSQKAINRFKEESKTKSALELRRDAKKIKILVSDYDVRKALVAGSHKRKSDDDCT